MVAGNVVTDVSDADSTIPPFGVLESPSDGAPVAGLTVVSGWALDLQDVPVSVDLLVDGIVVSRAQTRGQRPDVCAIYPFVSHCETRQPGFAVTWDTTRETTGSASHCCARARPKSSVWRSSVNER